MSTNLDRYRKDLEKLVFRGERLQLAMRLECFPEQSAAIIEQQPEVKEALSKLPAFRDGFQSWYSEAKVLIKQLLPDRFDDFVRHYEKPKSRKDLSNESYRIEDYLQGITATKGYQQEKLVGFEAAIPHFQQQLRIVMAVKDRFESSLFDIRQLVQADLFDSELSAAQELVKKGFARAAGAIAGVVLEMHLAQVCTNHSIKITKKNPTINDLNELLKHADIVDVPQWRFVAHLGDLRNLCDHNKAAEPTRDQAEHLVQGVAKIIKTLF